MDLVLLWNYNSFVTVEDGILPNYCTCSSNVVWMMLQSHGVSALYLQVHDERTQALYQAMEHRCKIP